MRKFIVILPATAALAIAPFVASALTVEPGDTLSELTAKHYGSADWDLVEAVAYHNAIADPNLIFVGQQVEFPRKAKLQAPENVPQPAVEAEHVPGTDWDGDGVIEPEPGTESTEIAIETESADDFSGDYDDEVTEDYGWTVWDDLAECESGGDWGISTGNGYYGGLQFSLGSWQAAGGSGYPHEHDRGTQIAIAENLLDMQGWGAWPSCASQLGLY